MKAYRPASGNARADIDRDAYEAIKNDLDALTTLSPLQAAWVAAVMASRAASGHLKFAAPAMARLFGPNMDRPFDAEEAGEAVNAMRAEVLRFAAENPDADDRDAFLFACGFCDAYLS
jgi:hypothetical protein